MKGFKVMISHKKDFKSYTYKIFSKRHIAVSYLNGQIALLKNRMSSIYYKIKKIDVFKCQSDWCDELVEEEGFCLSCEKLMLDAQLE